MRPLIAGNWKMNGLVAQLGVIRQIAASSSASSLAEVLICPPATLIAAAVKVAAGRIAIGGQDCSSEVAGAFTGDTSARMLKDAGATAVIVGHSERRRQHGETDAVVASKVRAAWREGLIAIVCIGETQAQRRAGQALSVCAEQLVGSLPEDAIASTTAIGYEPLWAIGSGNMPTADQIAEVHAHIRRTLVARWGKDGAATRILYGGSVKSSNARAILALPEVGGALVGGASLDADEFEAIVGSVPVAEEASG